MTLVPDMNTHVLWTSRGGKVDYMLDDGHGAFELETGHGRCGGGDSDMPPKMSTFKKYSMQGLLCALTANDLLTTDNACKHPAILSVM
jgi:hypothetical protein